MIKDSDEFIGIKILEKEIEQPQKIETVQDIASEGLTKTDITRLYGDESKATTKIKIEQQKNEIEAQRISIIKQVAYQINDLKNKINKDIELKLGVIPYSEFSFHAPCNR